MILNFFTEEEDNGNPDKQEINVYFDRNYIDKHSQKTRSTTKDEWHFHTKAPNLFFIARLSSKE